jgi:hypothetical protein
MQALAKFGASYGIAFQHADDHDDDEHAGFAAQARRRIHELVAEATIGVARIRRARCAALRPSPQVGR